MSFGIPDGTLYHDGPLGAGTIASSFDSTSVNTEHAGAAISFGSAVVLKDGEAVPATKAPIYGVALKRTYVKGENLEPETVQADKWQKNETLGVLRDGTIWVPISEDVNRGDSATVDDNGTFKVAKGDDGVVGVFTKAGYKDSTTELQTRIQLQAAATITTTPNTPSTPSGN